MTTATFLRDTTHAPRTTALLARHHGALVPERLERALELIWDDLLTQLSAPIVITDTPTADRRISGLSALHPQQANWLGESHALGATGGSAEIRPGRLSMKS